MYQSSAWSKLFRPKNESESASLNQYNAYSANPFHRPPSSAATHISAPASEASFRTGHSVTSNDTLKPHNNPYSIDSYYANNSFSSKSPPSSSSNASFVSARSSPPMSSHDLDLDEAECPVCLEPLSFSFRLPGEKPHVVPECGHALHEVRTRSLSLCTP